MEYNKLDFMKANNKKVLHKVRKHWVVISMALLMAIGGQVVRSHVSAHADSTNHINNSQPGTLRARLNQSLVQIHNHQGQTVLNQKSAVNNPQHSINNGRMDNNKGNQQADNNIIKQADVLHQRILRNADLNDNRDMSINSLPMSRQNNFSDLNDSGIDITKRHLSNVISPDVGDSTSSDFMFHGITCDGNPIYIHYDNENPVDGIDSTTNELVKSDTILYNPNPNGKLKITDGSLLFLLIYKSSSSINGPLIYNTYVDKFSNGYGGGNEPAYAFRVLSENPGNSITLQPIGLVNQMTFNTTSYGNMYLFRHNNNYPSPVTLTVNGNGKPVFTNNRGSQTITDSSPWWGNYYSGLSQANIDYKFGNDDLGTYSYLLPTNSRSDTIPISDLRTSVNGKNYAVDPRLSQQNITMSSGQTYTVQVDRAGTWGSVQWYLTPSSDTSITRRFGQGNLYIDGGNQGGTLSNPNAESASGPFGLDDIGIDSDESNVHSIDFNNVNAPVDSRSLFYGKNLTNVSDINLAGLNTNGVNNMAYMFHNDNHSLKHIDHLSYLKTSDVNNMQGMFMNSGISDVKGVSDWNVGKVTNLNSDFQGVSNLHDWSPIQDHWLFNSQPVDNNMLWNAGISNQRTPSTYQHSNLGNKWAFYDTNAQIDLHYEFNSGTDKSNVGTISDSQESNLNDVKSKVAIPQGYYIDPNNALTTTATTVTLNLLPDYIWSGYKWGQANVYFDSRNDTAYVDGGGQVGEDNGESATGYNQSFFRDVYKNANDNLSSDHNVLHQNFSSLPNSKKDWTVSVRDATAPSDSMYLFSFYGATGWNTQFDAVDLSGLHTHNVTNFRSIFIDDPTLKSINLSGLDLSNVTGLDWIFQSCPELSDLNLSNLYLPNLKTAGNMFNGDSSLRSLNIAGLSFGNVNNTSSNGGLFAGVPLQRLKVSSDVRLDRPGDNPQTWGPFFNGAVLVDDQGHSISTVPNRPDAETIFANKFRPPVHSVGSDRGRVYEIYLKSVPEVYYSPNNDQGYGTPLDAHQKANGGIIDDPEGNQPINGTAPDGRRSDEFSGYHGQVNSISVTPPNGYVNAPGQKPWQTDDQGHLVDKLNGKHEDGTGDVIFYVGDHSHVVGRGDVNGYVGKTGTVTSPAPNGYRVVNSADLHPVIHSELAGDDKNMLKGATSDDGHLHKRVYVQVVPDNETIPVFFYQNDDRSRILSGKNVPALTGDEGTTLNVNNYIKNAMPNGYQLGPGQVDRMQSILENYHVGTALDSDGVIGGSNTAGQIVNHGKINAIYVPVVASANLTVNFVDQRGNDLGSVPIQNPFSPSDPNHNAYLGEQVPLPTTNTQAYADGLDHNYHVVPGQPGSYVVSNVNDHEIVYVDGNEQNATAQVNLVYENSDGTTTGQPAERQVPVTLYGDNGDHVTFDPASLPQADYVADQHDYVLDTQRTASPDWAQIQNGNAHWVIDANSSVSVDKPTVYLMDANSSLRVVYLNQDGQKAGCSDVIRGRAGQHVNVTDPSDGGTKVPTGYQLRDGSRNVSGNNSDHGIYGNKQNTVYSLREGSHSVYLRVQGNSVPVNFKIYRILEDANGQTSALPPVNEHVNEDNGSDVYIDPTKPNLQPQGCTVDYGRDSAQYARIHYNSATQQYVADPGQFVLYYRKNQTSGAPIILRYIDEETKSQVGYTKILNGNLNAKAAVAESDPSGAESTDVAGEDVPIGYTIDTSKLSSDNLVGGNSGKTEQPVYQFTDSPQAINIWVQGDPKTLKLDLRIVERDALDQRTLYTSDVPITISGRIGQRFEINPYGFSSGGVIQSIQGLSHQHDSSAPKNGYDSSFKIPDNSHATISDADLSIGIDPNGQLSPLSHLQYTYVQNYAPTKVGTVRIHYVTDDKNNLKSNVVNSPNGKPKDNSEVDEVSDKGIIGDQDHSAGTFNLAPYRDDIPEKLVATDNYESANNAMNKDGSTIDNTLAGNQWQYYSNTNGFRNGIRDVYIQVKKRGTDGSSSDPIIIGTDGQQDN